MLGAVPVGTFCISPAVPSRAQAGTHESLDKLEAFLSKLALTEGMRPARVSKIAQVAALL